MNWYIVQAYSGFEKKVVESIKDVLTKSKLEAHLGEILVPTQEVTEVKKGKRTKKQKKKNRELMFDRTFIKFQKQIENTALIVNNGILVTVYRIQGKIWR